MGCHDELTSYVTYVGDMKAYDDWISVFVLRRFVWDVVEVSTSIPSSDYVGLPYGDFGLAIAEVTATILVICFQKARSADTAENRCSVGKLGLKKSKCSVEQSHQCIS